MSLATRIERIEKGVGHPNTPKLVIVTTAGEGHEIRRNGRDCLTLAVPWDEGYRDPAGPDPLGALTPLQRSLIGPGDKVDVLTIDPAELGPGRGIDGL